MDQPADLMGKQCSVSPLESGCQRPTPGKGGGSESSVPPATLAQAFVANTDGTGCLGHSCNVRARYRSKYPDIAFLTIPDTGHYR